jgi:hypothetical protein
VGAGGAFNPILRDRLGQAEPYQGENEDDDPGEAHPLVSGEHPAGNQSDNERDPHERTDWPI